MPGSKAADGAQGGARATTPAAFTLVHAVATGSNGKKALFSPTRLMNPVSYIGRTPGNDVVLASENVSRRHAKIIVTDMGLTVHDLDSHNGIFLNGKKVRSAPVAVGDLLYIADVCLELRRSPDADTLGEAAFAPRATSVAENDLTGEEDTDARCLDAVLRVSDLLGGDDEAFAQHVVEISRELVEATVAALVVRADDGELMTPVVLSPEQGKPLPVLWSVVRRALDEAAPQISADLKRDPLRGADDDDVSKQSEVGAVMAVPLVAARDRSGSQRTDEALYLARPTPGQMFTTREAAAVGAIAQMAALRRRRRIGAELDVDVDAHGDALAAQAKAEAAEERLREAQADVRALTERIHGLEADALKLKQQIEIERQNAVEAKRESERGRAEANKLEQGLHKTDEDLKRLKDALVRSEEERAKLKEAFKAADEDRKHKGAEIEKLREALKANEAEREGLRGEIGDHVRGAQEKDGELKRAEVELAERAEQLAQRDAEIERLKGELARVDDEARSTREGLERAVADHANAADVLKSALRATLPPSMAEHIEAAAAEERELVTEAAVRPVAALFITLRGFDAWATTASPDDVKRRLDHFCNSVALRARANGGRVEQVLGHSHLLMFNADAGSVRDAVRCGLEVAALVPDEQGGAFGPVGVASGLHVGPSVTGFFGEGDTATHVEAGEAVHVARGIAGLAHESSFYVTSAVHKLVAGDPAFVLGMVGPAALVGGPNVSLFRVLPAEQGGQEGGGG